MRQRMWLELFKEYNITILYHVSEANIVVDAFSRKTPSMGSLFFLKADERPLALEIQSLARQLIRLDISTSHSILTFVEARSSLMNHIRVHQFDHDMLRAVRNKVLRGEAKSVSLDPEEVLRINGRICVPKDFAFANAATVLYKYGDQKAWPSRMQPEAHECGGKALTPSKTRPRPREYGGKGLKPLRMRPRLRKCKEQLPGPP
ncbi:uncharacterized protein LOC129871283 [Solanum dulcamara]|uniref:uncharacterized protein LOC129871283 n=1 Tax=Solanum dulcamara TaxID=45834 RepID=UPI0024852E77|nr:uncharacterized protein LOC129871283 [Solanum dulcamara]